MVGLDRRTLLVGTGAVIAASPANAQDWLKKGLEIFEGINKSGGTRGLTSGDISLGLKEALKVSSERVVNRVGRRNGYFLDNVIKIPLPGSIKTAQSLMSAFGMSGMLDDLQLRLNRGAETAAPYAKQIFIDSITSMTINDAVGILNGPDNSATQYFQGKMTPRLTSTFHPIVERELDGAGAFSSLSNVTNRASGLPIGGSVSNYARTELVDHGLKYALSGIFHYLGQEEAAIRNNPAKRTSDILRKVFG